MAPTVATRLLAGVAALAAGAAAVVIAADVLRRTPGPVSLTSAPAAVAPAATPTRTRAWPAPPAGSIVFSREDGPNALALAVRPGEAQVSVVSGQGKGLAGLSVSVGSARATACGPGCYRATLSMPKPRAVDVRVGATRWHVALPWPAPGAASLMTRATTVWRSLASLTFYDRLASDPAHSVESTWRIVAPDRLAYHVRGGYDAVIIGGRRWDRAPGGKWVETPQTVPLRQPLPPWQSVVDAHVVGSTGTTWRVTFYDPGTPAWFAVTVEKRTLRTLDLHMITTAHFMFERYGGFDAPIAVAPPG